MEQEIKTYPCFGWDSLGQCAYDPTHPTVYFSIGQLLPLLIIFIAFYQILNPITKLKIESSRLCKLRLGFFGLREWMTNLQVSQNYKWLSKIFSYFLLWIVEPNLLLILGLLSIFSILIASVLPSIQNAHTFTLIGYPIFWELLSGFILIFVAIIMIRIITRQAKIGNRNLDIWFKYISQIINNNEEKYLVALANEMITYKRHENIIPFKDSPLRFIISTCQKYENTYTDLRYNAWNEVIIEEVVNGKKLNENESLDQYFFKKIKKDKDLKQKIQISPQQYLCFQILERLSDKSFLKTVSCKSPDYLREFFILCLQGSNITTQILINILKISFENEFSIFNRESQYNSLTDLIYRRNPSDELKKSVVPNPVFFHNPVFLNLSYKLNIFSYHLYYKLTEAWKIRLYFSYIKSCLIPYFENKIDVLSLFESHFVIVNQIIESLLLLTDINFEKQKSLYSEVGLELDNILNLLKNKKPLIEFPLNKKKRDKLILDICENIEWFFKGHYGDNNDIVSRVEYIKDIFIKNKEGISEQELNNLKDLYEECLHFTLGYTIFNLFINLSQIKVKNFNEEFAIRSIGRHFILSSINNHYSPYLKYLISLIKNFIDKESFTSKQHPYHLTRYILTFSGLSDPRKDTSKENLNKADELQVYLMDKLKKEFHKLYMTNKESALNLLSFNFSYNPSTKIITHSKTQMEGGDQTLQCE